MSCPSPEPAFPPEPWAVPAPPPPHPEAKRRRKHLSPALVPVSPSSPSIGSTSTRATENSAFDRDDKEAESISDWWTVDMPEVDEPQRFAIRELKKFIDEYSSADVDPFWHRKSGKTVLSVVICRSCTGDGLVTYRGVNTEVSLPAGSLCAERAAIAQTASAFQHAADILAIATADPKDKLNPLWPCEVCQSWLSKLRPQSPTIAVLAVATSACHAFAVRINGCLQPPPLAPSLPSAVLFPTTPWSELVELVGGGVEWPWEAREAVYVDGAWTFLHSGQQNILRTARSRGTHLLVGVHSDGVLRKEFKGPVLESFATRIGRIQQNRHVDSVLKDAPWILTHDLITSLGIRRVITGSVGKCQDVSRGQEQGDDPYRVARELGILEVVPSLDETTEWMVHEKSVARTQP